MNNDGMTHQETTAGHCTARQRKTAGAAQHIVRRVATLIPAALVFSALTACGGGSGGGGRSVPTAMPQTVNTAQPAPATTPEPDNTANTAQPAPTNDPQPSDTASPTQPTLLFDVTAHDFTTQGMPSTRTAAISALERVYNPWHVLEYGSEFGSVTEEVFSSEITIRRSFQPANDTRAYEAWAQGWTGRGVKVGILDDFQTPEDPFFGSITHGDYVSIVTYQVAPESDIAERQLTLGCAVEDQDANNQATTAFDYFNANGHHIVNASFGTPRYNDGSCPGQTAGLLSVADWRAAIDEAARNNIFLRVGQSSNTVGSYDANMLFVVAAGNTGLNCTEGVAGCDLFAAAVDHLRGNGDSNAGDRMVFVGALEDGTNNIASYSLTAGEEMKHDYMVAHDDVDSFGDNAGTSFAAPRVTGAAALVRHKFPNLNGAALKQVLLQTADDLGQPGVDNVFGYGELNILNALSPVGKVTSR